MIGNDVVDLALAQKQSNWKRKGYLYKIFTENEQILIENSENHNVAVWSLWSRKEAVYKILLQLGKSSGYYPKKIVCQDLNVENGIVTFEKEKYYTTTKVTDDFIYTEAVKEIENFENIKKIKDCQTIYKLNRIPYLKIDNKVHNVSKTHHGRYLRTIYLNL